MIEFKFVSRPITKLDELEAELNELGRQSWLLADFQIDSGVATVALERYVSEEEDS